MNIPDDVFTLRIVRVLVTLSAALIVAVTALTLFGRGARQPAQPPQAADGRGSPGPERKAASVREVPWREASLHIGEQVTVEGTIIGAHNTGKVCFLNFHPDYRKYLTAVVFASDFSRFPVPPEKRYLKKRIRLTGAVKEYKGRPEIIVRDPGQIEILE